MPKKNAAENAIESNNTNFGIPEGQLNPRLRNTLNKRTLDYYAQNPDQLLKTDWTLDGDNLNRNVAQSLFHRNLRTVLRGYKILGQIDENILLAYIKNSSFEDFQKDMNNVMNRKLCFYANQKLASDRPELERLKKHAGALYYAAKLDEAEEEETRDFLRKNDKMIRRMKAKATGMKEDTLMHNADVFDKYRALLATYIEEMHATDTTWKNSPAYDSLTAAMNRFDHRAHEKLSINDNVIQLRNNVEEFGEILSGIHDACNQYVKTHQPKEGKTYKDHKLSKSQLKRLCVISEISQLYDLFNQKSEKPYDFAENRDPFSTEFNKRLTALKLLNQHNYQMLKEGKRTKSGDCCRLMLDERCRNQQLNKFVDSHHAFSKMCCSQFRKYRKYEKETDARIIEKQFYLDLSAKNGKQLMKDFCPAKSAVHPVQIPQIGTLLPGM